MAASVTSDNAKLDEKVNEITVKNGGFELIGMVCGKNGVFNGTLVYGNARKINMESTNHVAVVNNNNRVGNRNPNRSNINNNNGELISGRTLRYDRAGSTDSVAVSSGGSDHGGSDTCQSSSSDTTSVSEPCSPEAGPESTSRPGTPQPMPPIPPSLAEDDHRHRHRTHSHHNHRLMDLEDRVQDHRVTSTAVIFRSLTAEADKSTRVVEPEPVAVWCATNIANASLETPEEEDSSIERFAAEAPSIAEVKSERLKDDCPVSTTTTTTTNVSAASVVEDCRPTKDKSVKRKRSDTNGIKVEPAEEDDETSCTSLVKARPQPKPADDKVCKWHGCKNDVPSDRLVEHMKSCHVDCQMKNETFTCLWVGCKVYNRPSCSVSWLQRHILSHGGNKPFKCIVEGCQHRFASQSALERHVNSHFNSAQANSNNLGGAGNATAGKAGKSKEDTPTKLIKKRKLRYRRRCWAVKTEDYFDAGAMEHLRHNLVEMERKCSLDTLGASRIVNFHSNVIARRVETSGKVNLLLHWTPEDVFPDSWISECQLEENLNKSVPLTSLPRDALFKLDPSLQSISRAKRRRK